MANSTDAWVQWLVAELRDMAARLPAAAETRVVGEARRALDRGSGWYRVNGVPEWLQDRLDSGFAREAGRDGRRFDILESLIDERAALIRVQVTAPAQGLELHVPSLDTRRQFTAMAARLDQATSPLVADVAARRLAAVPARRASLTTTRLNPAQSRALDACCASGLHVVWGPPGTGKT